MDRKIFRQSLLRAVLLFGIFAATGCSDEHDHGDHAHSGQEKSRESLDAVTIAPEIAQQSGITTALAAPGIVRETLPLFGRTVPDPERVSHVSARFPGVIRRSPASLGDSVEPGALLAEIEADNSLQPYQLRAPIGGVIVAKHANPGEYAAQQTLFTIADYSRLWVELKVFPRGAGQIRAGQTASLSSGERRAQSEVRFLNPGDANSPVLVANLPLDNSSASWSPGLMVEAEIVIREREYPLVLERRALQQVEEHTVVFVQEGDRYHPRRVQLGAGDRQWVQVREGLARGERYVLDNSYLIKAELEKSGSAHAH